MIWSLVKISVFIAVIAALSFVAALMIDAGGVIRVVIADAEISMAPITLFVGILLSIPAIWVVFYAVGLVNAVLRFIVGDETSISRYLDKNREKRGYEALADGMVALASGDPKLAMSRAARAERHLARPELTGILAAEAAVRSGDRDRAIFAYRNLVKDEKTRFAGLAGVLKFKLEDGDSEVALRVAEEAFALNPRHEDIQKTLLRMQTSGEDWAGARRTLSEMLKSRSISKDVFVRRNGVLMFADGREMIARGEREAGERAVLEASRAAPGFVPGASLAAEIKIRNGEKRTAARILRKAWNSGPHPDLASRFAALEPDETPDARIKRFKQLLGSHGADPESRMIRAELQIAKEDFHAARKELGRLPEEMPTVRSLVMMAAVERGLGSSEEVVRSWLTRAVSAPRGRQWVCDACRNVSDEWSPTCRGCGGFDTLAWQEEPESGRIHQSSIGMLPLVVSKLEAPKEPDEGSDPESEADIEEGASSEEGQDAAARSN